MSTVQKFVAVWVLVIGGFALMAGAAYVARADAADTFGGSESGGNTPRQNRAPANNSSSGKGPAVKREPIPEGESVWEDVPESELTNKERLASRPGNLAVLVSLYNQFDGLMQVAPEWRELAFPFRGDTTRVKSKDDVETLREYGTDISATREDFDAHWAELEQSIRERGKKEQNSARKVNLFIEKLEMLDFAPDQTDGLDLAAFGLSERQIKVFAELRKDHPEQGCFVKATFRSEYLASEKIHTKESIACMIRKPEGWKICWQVQDERK